MTEYAELRRALTVAPSGETRLAIIDGLPDTIAALLAERDALRNALMDLLGAVNGLAPERNCSCHISPPCHDCIEYGGLRDAEEHARNVLMRDKREQS